MIDGWVVKHRGSSGICGSTIPQAVLCNCRMFVFVKQIFGNDNYDGLDASLLTVQGASGNFVLDPLFRFQRSASRVPVTATTGAGVRAGPFPSVRVPIPSRLPVICNPYALATPVAAVCSFVPLVGPPASLSASTSGSGTTGSASQSGMTMSGSSSGGIPPSSSQSLSGSISQTGLSGSASGQSGSSSGSGGMMLPSGSASGMSSGTGPARVSSDSSTAVHSNASVPAPTTTLIPTSAPTILPTTAAPTSPPRPSELSAMQVILQLAVTIDIVHADPAVFAAQFIMVCQVVI